MGIGTKLSRGELRVRPPEKKCILLPVRLILVNLSGEWLQLKHAP